MSNFIAPYFVTSMHLKRVYVFFLKSASQVKDSFHPGCMTFGINPESSGESPAAAAAS